MKYKDVENWYNLQGYYGEIIKINDKTFQFKDYKATSKIDELLSQIQEYNSKLFRPVIYYDTVMRTGFPDVLLIRDELKKAGFKDAGGTWSDQRQDCWELKTNVFGSSFVFEVYIKHEWDSRYFDVCYSMSGHFFSPFYKVRCLVFYLLS